ncbi:MAG: DUF5074 domain-containing protein [Bacteroidia bacterium]|nr:DUF5074 domain-containing protein [Bacteroidia bacterium]
MKAYYVYACLLALGGGVASCSGDDLITDQGSGSKGEKTEKVKVIKDSTPSAVVAASGFYVANEDWFGHENGSVNYFKLNGEGGYDITYRAYRLANANEQLGVTTQYGAIWGDYAYFLSKQGNRLVVADAKTMKKKAVFTEIGGDGRAFAGVDDKLAYISHGAGLRQFDIEHLALGAPVEGISEEVGSICYAEGHLYAVSSDHFYLIDVATNTIKKSVDGKFSYLVRSKDGMIWVAESKKFIHINPKTLEETEVAYPENIGVAGTWYAWTAGALCASTQKNELYWTKGGGWSGSKVVVKYDIDTQKANTAFFTLGKDEAGKQLAFYGAGLRVDPLTDKLIMTVKRDGWADNGSYNWVYVVSPSGTLEKELVLKGGTEESASYSTPAKDNNYYWFPAMPFFEDANAPEILTNQILVLAGKTTTVDLNKTVVDADNMSTSIIRRVEFPTTDLVTYTFENGLLSVTAKDKTGHLTCKVIALSNGRRVEKTVAIDVVATAADVEN